MNRVVPAPQGLVALTVVFELMYLFDIVSYEAAVTTLLGILILAVCVLLERESR